MTSNPGAVGALILVPIAIVGSVAFIAIKTTHFWKKTSRRYKAVFARPQSDRKKQRRSNLSTSQEYADSWCDLESTYSCEEGNIVQLSPAKDTLSRSEINRPEPLRIIKERANTIASYNTPREVPVPRRGSVGHTYSHGSSPESLNTSLTVFKRRRARGSVLDGGLERNASKIALSSEVNHATKLHNFSQKNSDAFSRARWSTTRIFSVGSFLKSELFEGGSEGEFNITRPQPVKAQTRNRDDTFNPLNMELSPLFKLGDLEPNQDLLCKPSQRRESIGKKLVSKAFDGLGNARSKSMQFLHSKSSKDTLLRRVSLKNLGSSRQNSSEASSRNSPRFSFDQESVLTRDSRSSLATYPDDFPHLPTLSFMLYPEIAVIPEVETVDFGDEVSFWVAVVVTGVLRNTMSCDMIPNTLLTTTKPGTSQAEIMPRNTGYGYLYGMDITLAARKGSVLESVITGQNQLRYLHLGQTMLTLAKVKLLVGRRSSSHVRESSKELIAELESRLGNATTEYLTIGISYKHSVIPTSRSSTIGMNGLSYRATIMRIEAHAVIKCHCSESLWSCQTSVNRDSSRVPNPLLSLIAAHYSPAEAARLINRIAPDPLSLTDVHRRDVDTDRQWNSSSDTITPISRKSSADMVRQAGKIEDPISLAASKQSLDITQARFHDTDCSRVTLALNPCSDPDPARKIWSDMRKTSRCTTRNGSWPVRTLENGMDDGIGGSSDEELNARNEQARLMELALKNKRSLGADTLRSMAAPSTPMGLGAGRGWGWGPPWW